MQLIRIEQCLLDWETPALHLRAVILLLDTHNEYGVIESVEKYTSDFFSFVEVDDLLQSTDYTSLINYCARILSIHLL